MNANIHGTPINTKLISNEALELCSIPKFLVVLVPAKNILHSASTMANKTVLVTGANGFLGNAVAKAFAKAGWKTYGLIRRETAAHDLWTHEVIPVIGSAADPSFVDNLPPIDVIAATTEDLTNYKDHFNDNVYMFKLIAEHNREADGTTVKPLVIFTSGCKDYGTSLRHGDPGLEPQTENSPLNPLPPIRVRCEASVTIFDHEDTFDAVLTRPTTLYGSTMTYYAPLFDAAMQAAATESKELTLKTDPNSILHGTHVFDVANAYVTIASSPREKVAGQAFNISSHRYETAREVVGAIGRSYGINVQFLGRQPFSKDSIDFLQFLVDVPQWVDSTKLRSVTGWEDWMPLFTEDFERYRGVYEAFASSGHERIAVMTERTSGGRGIN